MSGVDRIVLRALQVLVLALPLFLGGRHPLGVAAGLLGVLVLLGLTMRERSRREAPAPVGVTALAAFVGLALATTVPLPPSALRLLSPHAADLYAELLPGWPGDGGWSEWRPLALDRFGAWYELCKLGVGIGAFAVLVSYPWQATAEEDAPRERVFGSLLLTLIAGGAALSVLALVQQVAGNGQILWLTGEETSPSRASGPFVNPNHLAAWLEMVIPVAVAYFGALATRLGRRVAYMAKTSLGMGVRARRAWAGALAAHQRRLWLPLLLAAAVMLMVVTHLATGSRGGTAALLVGLGVTARGFAVRSKRGILRTRPRRLLPAALAAGLAALALVSIFLWARVEDEVGGAAREGDVSLASRVAVAAQGRDVVADFPLLGSGLGSWLHAFRPYQRPPVEGGIWDHAHNDYLEIAAETGAAGLALLAWFALVVCRAARQPAEETGEPRPVGRGGADWAGPSVFERPDWRAALAERTWLRFGIAGGIAAILVHSLVDFSLRMPANLLVLMVLLGMFLLTKRTQASRSSLALGTLAVLLVAAAVPLVASRLLSAVGSDPIDPAALLVRADLDLAETGDHERAIARVHSAIDASPADRQGHEALARVLGESPDSATALRRAIRLNPWAAELRDRLASDLWQRGSAEDAAVELEESVARYPYLVSHQYPDASAAPRDEADDFLRRLSTQNPLRVDLERLDPALANAVERGLRRALEERPAGAERQAIIEDLVLLLEVRERYLEAATELRSASGVAPDDAPRLAHAAQDYFRAGDLIGAQQSLIAALKLAPEQGTLYRRLAVEVFAKQSDFGAAEKVLRAAEQNSQDMLPVYEGFTQVLALREAARFEESVAVPVSTAEVDDDLSGVDVAQVGRFSP